MGIKFTGIKDAHSFRNALAALYELKLQGMKDKAGRYPNTDVNRIVLEDKVRLLKFLIKELKEIEITR